MGIIIWLDARSMSRLTMVLPDWTGFKNDHASIDNAFPYNF